MSTSEWVRKLCERLEVLRDMASENAEKESQQRKMSYDRGKVLRTYKEKNLVLCGIPGMSRKITDSWEGPFQMAKKHSEVNYAVKEVGGRSCSWVIHINNAKTFHEQDLSVFAITVIAEEKTLEQVNTKFFAECCKGFEEAELKETLDKFEDVLTDEPEKTWVLIVKIILEDNAKVILQRPYHLPDKLKPQVEKELNNLLAAGIIEESDSAYGRNHQ